MTEKFLISFARYYLLSINLNSYIIAQLFVFCYIILNSIEDYANFKQHNNYDFWNSNRGSIKNL
jgi:hypothetical protein